MTITYTEEKWFTKKEQAQDLFLSVGWISGQYPERLFRALQPSSTVLTTWEDNRLVGLARVLDDGELVAFIHYVLVHPDYQGKGIAGTMLTKLKEKYQSYLYLEVMPEERKNVPFYEKHGFQVLPDGTPMKISNFSNPTWFCPKQPRPFMVKGCFCNIAHFLWTNLRSFNAEYIHPLLTIQSKVLK